MAGLVQGIGVTPFADLPTDPKIFTQISIPETVKIPKVKPEMEQLISVTVDAVVISTRLIKTATGTSNEGQILTGYKLIIELKLKQKVKYVADEPTQSVHAAHFEKIINSIFVVVPPTIDVMTPTGLVTTSIETLFKQGRLVVTPYIEDIFAEMRDKRTVFKNITLLVTVKGV